MLEIFAFLVNLLVVDPFQDELNQRLAQVDAPQAVISEVGSCASTAVPALAERVSSDPWWGVTTVVLIWVGQTTADEVLGQTVPNCENAIRTARTYLQGRAASEDIEA